MGLRIGVTRGPAGSFACTHIRCIVPKMPRDTPMLHRSFARTIALAALCLAGAGAQAQDALKYPDWSGQMRWTATSGGNRYDQTKPPGRGQQAPLTPEYQAIFEAGLKDQAEGGQGGNATYACIPGGLP